MSKIYLRYLDSLVCCICGNCQDVTHHHLLRVRKKYLQPLEGYAGLAFPKIEGRGMGKKNADHFAVPVCFYCHAKIHNEGRQYEQANIGGSMEPEEYALLLFKRFQASRTHSCAFCANQFICHHVVSDCSCFNCDKFEGSCQGLQISGNLTCRR